MGLNLFHVSVVNRGASFQIYLIFVFSEVAGIVNLSIAIKCIQQDAIIDRPAISEIHDAFART